MPEYTHTLIPEHCDFVPAPKQVAGFLSSLVSIGAAPLRPVIDTFQLSGEVRSFTNPFSGEAESRPICKANRLHALAEVPGRLNGLDDYNVTMTGRGPPALPALIFDFKGAYDFLIHCCLRAEVVSTSDWHDDVPIGRDVAFFGRPCHPTDRLGIYHNPYTLEVIVVPNAGCARFWVEFEYGKMLFPAIDDRLDLIEPKIVEVAEKDFGIKFVQGCHWCP